MSDVSNVIDLWVSKFAEAAGSNKDARTAINTLTCGMPFFDKASADAMASTTTSETYTGVYIPYDSKVTVYFNPTSGSLTANDTNYATVTVSKRDSAAANKATIATLTTTTTSSGNLTQGAGKQLVAASGSASVAAGSTITFEIAKTGTGVVVPAGRFTVVCEKI